jgi:HK97 family phage major capsid protein
MLDKELKELLEKAQEAIGNQAQMQKAIDAINAWGAENGRLKQAENAIKQIEEKHHQITVDLDAKIASAARRAYDGNGNYRGHFASETQARTFALSVIAGTAPEGSDARKLAVKILAHEHKDFADRQKDVSGEQALIAHEHSTRVHRLVEDSSVWARHAFAMPMGTSEVSFTRRVSGFRAHKTKARATVAKQDMQVAPVNLTVSDFDILTSYPKQLEADSLVPIAEMLMGEMSLGFSLALEEDGLIGDGSAAYDNETGLTFLLKQINGVDEGGGLVLATGANGAGWSSIVNNDILKLIGRARNVRPGMGVLIGSNEFFWTVLAKLITAAGGVTKMEMENGFSLNFFGVPYEVSHVMPRSAGNSQIPLLYGDLGQSSTLGNRQQTTIETSREVYFTTKEIAVLATSRYAINNHSLGDDTPAGPVTGLITPAA